MGHQNWRYTSEEEMSKTGKKRERNGSSEKEYKKKPRRAPISCAICESTGESEPPAFNSNRELFKHVVNCHMEEWYKCGRCGKNTDRSHVSEFVSAGGEGKNAHSCFRKSQPFQVLQVTEPYNLAGEVEILKRHYPDLKPEAVQEYLDCRDTGLAEKYSRIDLDAYKPVVLTKKER